MKREIDKLKNDLLEQKSFLRSVLENYLVNCRRDLLCKAYADPLYIYIDLRNDEVTLEQVGESIGPGGNKGFVTLRLSGEFEQKEVKRFCYEDHHQEPTYHNPIYDILGDDMILPGWLQYPTANFEEPIDPFDKRYRLHSRETEKEALGIVKTDILLNVSFTKGEDGSIRFENVYIADPEGKKYLRGKNGEPLYVRSVERIIEGEDPDGQDNYEIEEQLKGVKEYFSRYFNIK